MSKVLTAFFSASGTTAQAARVLADTLGTDLYEIKPAVPYSEPDLNYRNRDSRSSREMHAPSIRPELAATDADITPYDTILLGFPVWWYIAPTIINTFLESYDFSGKRIILFATSGGSDLGKAAEGLQPSAPGAKIEEGMVKRPGVTEADWKNWALSLNL